MRQENATIIRFLEQKQDEIVQGWATEYAAIARGSRRTAASLQGEQAELYGHLLRALREDGDAADFENATWAELRDSLARLSASRAAQSSTAADTSAFVLSLKRPLFDLLQREELGKNEQIQALWNISAIVDRMAQWTVAVYQQTREDIISRQQDELLELSTPVIKLWEGVLAVPIIGTLDSSRAQMVMESLLERIVQTGSELAIIDITGVPTVDTLVAQHLLKTVTALRLMGAESIISGIRPQIAQTIVHLGIDLQGIATKATLADALAVALRMTGHTIARVQD